jgi:hypothetical protein
MEDRYIAYMASFSELRPQHDKAIKVILSCQTFEQLVVAEKYCTLLYKMHLSSLKDSYPSMKFRYQISLEESRTLITEAFAYQRKRIKLQRKRKG